MKQFIVELNKDTSEAGFLKLAKWATERKYWNIITDKTISIGQMIEFLFAQGGTHNPVTWPLYEASGMGWDSEGPTWGKPKVETLRDDLWEAVKQVLEI